MAISLTTNYKYPPGRVSGVIISIPLDSPPLLAAAALMAMGFLAYPFSARAGVAAIGAGAVIMGVVVLLGLPRAFLLQGALLFGMAVVVGAWMIYVAAREG
ncbi:MAG: hypothetical protein QUS08_02315 [Methanothrix sp.]|nr:hypothetical protein [Methanothrix sp.]